jgi:hypothetical protein
MMLSSILKTKQVNGLHAQSAETELDPRNLSPDMDVLPISSIKVSNISTAWIVELELKGISCC